MTVFRIYTAAECSLDGYPRAWHRLPAGHPLLVEIDRDHGGIKHVVRALADHRCVRCLHPYRGGGQWTACDEQCTHRGPYRYRHGPEDQWFVTYEDEPWIEPAGTGPAVGIEIQAQWRILTVHHLNGVKADCRWWNLAALCQRCHLQIQGKVVMDRRWLHEHSEWFKPYVAGFYAATRLGVELTREEVMVRLDELLALEDRQLTLEAGR